MKRDLELSSRNHEGNVSIAIGIMIAIAIGIMIAVLLTMTIMVVKLAEMDLIIDSIMKMVSYLNICCVHLKTGIFFDFKK